MIFNAKKLGANAIGDITWYASGNSTPTCKKGWGYFVIWPFILTPLFMSTKVMGKAYKVAGTKHGLLMLPNNAVETEAFVARVLNGKY
jgi:hypothetical protein